MSRSQLQERPAVSPRGDWDFPSAERWSTERGVEGRHISVPGSGLADFTVHIDAPLAAEPAGAEGITDVLVRCLAEGTSTQKDAAEFAAAMDEIGATFEAQATARGLQLQVGVPSHGAASALQLVAQLIREPLFTRTGVSRMVANNLDAHAEMIASAPRRALSELYATAFASGSRPSLPAGGVPATVSRIDHDAVEQYWSSIAGPQRIRVLSAGELSVDDMRTLGAAAFDGWAASPMPRRSAPEIRAAAPRLRLVDQPGAVQTAVAIGAPTVSRRHHDHAAASVASYVLGVPINSRLSLRLREEKGYTYGVRASLRPDVDCGLFTISTEVERDVTVPALEDLYAILSAFRADGITAGEHANAVEGLLGKDPIEFQTSDRLMHQLAEQEAYGLAGDWLAEHRRAIQESTPSSCSEAFAVHVPADLSLVLVGDAEMLEPALIAAGWNVEVTA